MVIVKRLCFLAAVLVPGLFTAVVIAATPSTTTVVTAGHARQITVKSEAAANDDRVFVDGGGPSRLWSMTLPAARLHDVVIQDKRAYVAADRGGLFVIDHVSQPDAELLSRHTVGDRATIVRMTGNTVYLGADGGVYRLDLSDPENPQTLAYVKTARPVADLSVSARYLVALLTDGTIQIIDISQVDTMHTLSAETIPVTGRALAIWQNMLLLACADQGVRVYQLTDQGLKEKSRYQTTGVAHDLVVANGIAYVATGTNGLTLLELAAGGTLHWLGSHQQLGDVRHVEVKDDAVLVSNKQGYLIRIDASNPVQPSAQAFYRYPAGLAGWRPVADDEVFLVAGQSLTEIDFSAEQPVLSNEGLDSGQGVNYGGQRRVFIRDNLAYVADWFSGIHIYDISSPRQLRLLSSFHTEGSPKGIIVRGDYAYVADDDHGLQILDISHPRQPFRVSELRTEGLAYIPVLDGNRLYLAGHRGGFQIIDISDVRQPHLLGQHDTTGKTWAIRVKGKHAYIADDDGGLEIYDVADPQNIHMVGQFNPGGDAEDVILEGDKAYVAFFENGVFVVDISDPSFPQQLAHIDTPGNARGLAKHGDELYVADWLSGIQVIKVNPTRTAAITGSYDTVGAAWGLAIAGTYAYVMDWWGGITVLDISRASAPQFVSRYHEREPVIDIKARGKVLYAANGASGLQLFDIKNALNPTWMTGVELDGKAQAVALGETVAYVAMDNKRLAMVDVQNPYQARLVSTMRMPLRAERLVTSEQYLLAGQRDREIDLFSLVKPQRPKKLMRIKTAWRDFTFGNHRLYIIDGDGTLRIYEKNDKGQLHEAKALDGDYKHMALWNDRQLLLATATDLLLLDLTTGQTSAQLMMPGIRSLVVMSGQAHIATTGRLIYQVQPSDTGELKILGRQTLRAAINELVAHDNALYGTGNRTIMAVSPLPELTILPQARSGYQFTVPAGFPLGDYNLAVQSPSGSRNIITNAFSVRMPRFSKPTITLEEIQRRMKELTDKPAR